MQMDFDEEIRDVRRGFTAIENNFDLTIYELRGRLARMDWLTGPTVQTVPQPGPGDTAVNLPASVPVFGPRAVYGPLTRPHAEPVIPAAVELHASLPWWRRWLRRMDRWFARQFEEVAS